MDYDYLYDPPYTSNSLYQIVHEQEPSQVTILTISLGAGAVQGASVLIWTLVGERHAVVGEVFLECGEQRVLAGAAVAAEVVHVDAPHHDAAEALGLEPVDLQEAQEGGYFDGARRGALVTKVSQSGVMAGQEEPLSECLNACQWL